MKEYLNIKAVQKVPYAIGDYVEPRGLLFYRYFEGYKFPVIKRGVGKCLIEEVEIPENSRLRVKDKDYYQKKESRLLRDISGLNYIIKADDGSRYYVNFLQIEGYKEKELEFEADGAERENKTSCTTTSEPLSILDWNRFDTVIQVCAFISILLAVIGVYLSISEYSNLLKYVGQGVFSILRKFGLSGGSTAISGIAYQRNVLSLYLSSVILYAVGLAGGIVTCVLSYKRKAEKMNYLFHKI